MKSTSATAVFVLAMAAALPAVAAESAATYPSKPIRIMGQGAGSTADYLSRFLGQKLTERWGQAVVVDNRSGAGGTISSDVVAKAAPDGYTLVMGHAGTHVSAVSLYKDLPYDPIRDFAPITRVTTGVTVLVVHPSVPVSTAQELIAYAKQQGNLNYASAGNGTISHLTGELFNQVAGLKLVHVPYKSAGQALIALLGNETQVSFLSPITAHTQIRSGRVKALAVSSRARFPGAPDIPSATEAGIPGMEALLWFGLFAPAQTPQPIVMKLNQTIGEILRQPEVKEAILKQGAEVAPSTPDELRAFVRSELVKWTKVIKDAGIKAD
ncbi:MAG: tripartite tricarboxylate transporter substrate binding protein [Betaproteobacteria bacterium]|nr:tripartite tricarboxylate transporter substrate binding protein [Betaproteobacteria bacterium]